MTKDSKIADPNRLEAIRDSGLLDSPPKPDFDRLAKLAAQLLKAPAAFVTVIAEDRQYLKSAVADGERTSDAGTSTDLDRSFCKHTVSSGEPFIVEDAREHELVKDSAAVAEGVIAYAGIPLKDANGHALGALCVVDSKPRRWSEDDIDNLRALARGAMQLIEEHRSAGATNGHSPSGEDSLVGCVTEHLRASSDYAKLVGSAKQLDLDEETASRERLIRSQQELRSCYERQAEAAAAAAPPLQLAVRRYLDADQQREQAARAFGQGVTSLDQLESAIERHMDAADALRITAIDHGADL